MTTIASCTDAYGDDRDMRVAEADMRVLGLCFGLTLLLSVEPDIAAQDAPTDATRPEVTAVADASIKQNGAGQLAPDTRGATAAVPRTATMMIAPAPVIDSSGRNVHWHGRRQQRLLGSTLARSTFILTVDRRQA